MKIKKPIEELKNYINVINLYNANIKIINYYPTIEKQAKIFGLVGKSMPELKSILEIKCTELDMLIAKQDELKNNIEIEKDIINKNEDKISILKRS